MKKLFARKIKALATCSAILCTALTFPVGMNVQKAEAVEVDANFAKALQYSIYFYDANMCGTEVSENNEYSWRGDCHTQDATLPLNSKYTNMSDSFIVAHKDILDPDGDGTVDVAGGFHDAGDHVKFGLPEAYSGSTLGWGYYEFREAYEKTGQDAHIETILRYFNDYFMKCTFRDASGKVVAFCYQVGDGGIDHSIWSAPELQGDMFRPARFATSEDAATDCVSNSAASLAINYLNFKDTDPEYAEKCLDYAIALFDFAINTQNKDCGSDGGGGFYTSQKWEDDYCWGAVWLYTITKEKKYLDIIFEYLDYYAPSCWVHCWNDVWGGVLCLLAEADDRENFVGAYKEYTGKVYEDIDFWSQVGKTVDVWMTQYNTPGGYAFLDQWGSARYNTAAQLMALVYDKHNGGVSKYSQWAKGQMEYLMGDNPLGRCYIVGFNENSVKYPHHRAASGLTMAEDPREHRYVLYGALVGGPGANDEHNDTTADWIFNEVTIDYNAAFVGACAGLYYFFGNDSMQVTPNFPPTLIEEEIETRYWVEAFGIDDGKVTAVTLYVFGTAPVADKKISVRYYFDTKGMSSLAPNDLELRQYYDQVSAETEFAAKLSGPFQYKDTSIYYVEVSWPDFAIANSNKKYQFAIGSYNVNNKWDPSDDWSHQDLAIATDAFTGVTEETPYICVYSDGKLVGGIEPDGSTPVKEVTLKDVKKSVLGVKKAVAAEDLNNDKKVNVFDVIAKKRSMINK